MLASIDSDEQKLLALQKIEIWGGSDWFNSEYSWTKLSDEDKKMMYR